MNILFLTRRFYPEIGGVEKHVLEVSRELIRRGNKVTVITENFTSNYHSKYQSDTYGINLKQPAKSIQNDSFEAEKNTVVRINPGKNDWFKKFRIWRELFRYIRLFREANVVHCHDVFFWYLPFRLLFPLKKVYVTFHGYETKFPPTLKAKIVRKVSEKLSYGNICVGDYIRKWYGTKPNYVVYGGAPEIQNPRPKIQKINKDKKKINILLMGRLEEDNGAKIYLGALKMLKKRKVSYNLTVCGDGTFKKEFSRLGVIKGFVSNMNKYIDRADFVFASSYLSILEAIIRGKKVFSVYQNDIKKDYLNLSPFVKYISISNGENSLINQLNYTLNSTNKSYNIQRNAYNWAKSQTWENISDIYLKLWKS